MSASDKRKARNTIGSFILILLLGTPAVQARGEEATAPSEDLQKAAEMYLKAPEPKEDDLPTKVFKGGQRALQRLNPEISPVGDILAGYINQDGNDFSDYMRSGFKFRVLDIHLQANLDPFSLMKFAVEVHDDGVELGEGYIKWYRIPRLSITLGKFRQQLGVVNRWHKHALDQVDFPLIITENLGPGGLNQVGVSLDWLMPAFLADEQEAFLQITNSENEKLFSGPDYSIPAVLLHLRNYWDLSRDAYIEVGLTGLHGYNHKENAENKESARRSDAAGLDISFLWEPVNQAKYRSLEWRSEFLYVYKEEPGGSDTETYGGYSYLQYKFRRNWIVGVRGDILEGDLFGGEDTPPISSSWLWQASPYLTWRQSPWVRLRLEYDHVNGQPEGTENRILFQATFAAGPHKHDRY